MISGKAEHEALKDRCVKRIYGISRPFILSDADRVAIVDAVLAEVRRTLETVTLEMVRAGKAAVGFDSTLSDSDIKELLTEWLGALLRASPLGEVLAEIKPREGSAS